MTASAASWLEPLLARISPRLANSAIVRRIAGGAFWVLFGSAASRVLALAAGMLVARALQRETYGELAVVQSTAGMLQAFASFGMGTTATKFIAEHRRSQPELAGRIMALSSIVSAVFGIVIAGAALFFADTIALHVLDAPSVAPALRIGAGLLLFGAINGAQQGALVGFEAFRVAAWANVATAILSFPFAVGGALLGGLEGATAGLVAGAGVGCIVFRIAIARVTREAGLVVRYREALKEWRILLGFSLPATLATLLVAPVTWACSAILVREPGGYAQMGLFGAASQWRAAILFVPGALGSIALPLLASLSKPSERGRFLRVFWANAGITAGAALAVAAVVAVFSGTIMRAYGPGYVDGSAVLIILSLAAVLNATLNVVGQVIASQGQMWAGFILNAIWGTVLLAATWYWRGHGAVGLASAYLVAYGVHFTTVAVFVFRTLRRARGNT